MKCLRVTVFTLICLSSIVLGCWLRASYAPEWRQVGASGPFRPWAVEADCYSQLARVQRILAGQGLIQNHFTVENWPEGLTPSTTAPFDYAILLLYLPLTLFTQYPLDWAGALISPVLWVGLALFWIFFRSRQFNQVGRVLLVAGSAALPALIWATACGRPRHQSLIFFLMAIALTAEYERWQIDLSHKRFWNIFAGAIWGLACWTSLFEPTLVVGLLILFNLIVRHREDFAFLISFGVVMLVALLLEGFHIFIPPARYNEALINWWSTIAEVRGMSVALLMQEMTFVLILLPVLSWRLLAREGDHRTDLFLILLTLLLTIISTFQQRWIYYANLGELFLVVRYCQRLPMRWWRAIVIVLFFVGLFDADKRYLQAKADSPANLPSPELAYLSHSIDKPGGIMAPWWISPGLLYFSGQPIVTGSSHCGISGIVDGAKFYAATSWLDAERILRDRKVRWVVVYEDRTIYGGHYQYIYQLLNTSRGILGLPPYGDDDKNAADLTVAQILIADRFVPTSLQLRAVTDKLKLYEFLPNATP